MVALADVAEAQSRPEDDASVHAGIGLVGESSSLPAGAALEAAVWLSHRAVGAAILSARYHVPRHVAVDEQASASFSAFSLGLNACPLGVSDVQLPRPFALPPIANVRLCAGVDFGLLDVEGRGFRVTRRHDQLTLDARIQLRTEWRARFGVAWVAGSVIAPLRRDRFMYRDRVDVAHEVFRAHAVGGEISVGIGMWTGL